jgi:hypothetical protein
MTLLGSVVALAATGCGGGGGSSSMDEAPPPLQPQNAAPSVSSVPDQSMDEDSVAGPFKVVVTDLETSASDLDLSITSSDSTLLPAAGLDLAPDLAGDGTDHLLTLIPASAQAGSAEVTLTVTDEDGASTSSSFRVAVNPLVRAEFSSWMRETVLARDEFDGAVGEEPGDGVSLTDTEDILRIKFSDATAREPAAYDDLLPPG